MAMIVAQRAGKYVKVSRNTYESVYKDKGFRIVGEKRASRKEAAREEKKRDTEIEQDDFDGVPISEMSKDQLAEYAKKHNIDTSHAKSVSDARRIIREEIKRRRV